MEIKTATTDTDIERCYDVMAQLRPHIERDAFVARVREQMQSGYRLAFVERDGHVCSVAGYRYGLNLAWGRHMYVDDLVSDAGRRSTGCGRHLLEWLITDARARGCAQLHLDSGVQRFRAHKFYLREGMFLSSHHFTMEL